MLKLINEHFGKIVSVEPTEKSKEDKSWRWRKDYEGFIGIINVYESQLMSQRHHFIVAYDDMRSIQTSAGTLIYVEILREIFIVLETRNSTYTIKLLDTDPTKENK